jgi:hypothetical protein
MQRLRQLQAQALVDIMQVVVVVRTHQQLALLVDLAVVVQVEAAVQLAQA